MYEHHNHVLSIPARLLYEDWDLMNYNTYKSHCVRGKLVRTKEGRGAGNEAFVSYYDLPRDIKELCIEKLGDPKEVVVVNILEEYLFSDIEAARFFSSHRTPNGKSLSMLKQRERATSAMILNAIKLILNDKGAMSKAFGRKRTQLWENISEAVNAIDSDKWEFNLPGNPRSLRRKYEKYIKEGYWAFIHKGEGSNNATKVTADIESLIISLYCLPNKPYITSVHDLYLEFLDGEIEVIDIKTGEVFDRNEFYDNGEPVKISERTVGNYINKRKNRLIISKFRDGAYEFSQKSRPHVNRTRAQFSMSKISLDDRDIMHTKMHDGSKVMAYYAFDTMSGAMIGIAHSRDKNHELYLDCIRNMFRFTTNKGLGVPMQMEVENHLVKDFKDGLMRAGTIFPFVRWCNPTNGQEKKAERFIGAKKYGVEKDNNQNVGRHYSRRASNRITNQKIFDSENDNYKHAKSSFKEIVANELQEQIDYNNELHSDQVRFKGMTRMQVFLANVNPDLPELDRAQLAKYIGFHKQTSVRRNQYCVVQRNKYQLASPETIELLAHNNLNVDAYYIPSELNEIDEIFIYQDNHFICECKPAPTFNEANAEWTEKDAQGYQDATKYISQFDAMVKNETQTKLSKVTILKKSRIPIDVTPETVPEVETELEYEYEPTDSYSVHNRAINDL